MCHFYMQVVELFPTLYLLRMDVSTQNTHFYRPDLVFLGKIRIFSI